VTGRQATRFVTVGRSKREARSELVRLLAGVQAGLAIKAPKTKAGRRMVLNSIFGRHRAPEPWRRQQEPRLALRNSACVVQQPLNATRGTNKCLPILTVGNWPLLAAS
jgi:hypothetical protein